jgi:NADH-quinone oxidoreductase subunit M
VIGALLAAEAASSSFTVLPALIVVPLLTAVAIAVLPSGPVPAAVAGSHASTAGNYAKVTALVGSFITGMLSLYVFWNFDASDGGLQFATRADWIPALGVSWFFAVDGISLLMVVLTGILFPIAILTTEPHHDAKPFYLWLMLLMAGSMGAFMALDLLLFFLFFEVVLVPMYFLIGRWGHGNRVYAAMKFFLYTMAASALMLVGIVSLVFLARPDTGGLTFDVVALAENHNLSDTAALLVFLSFALAFAVKVPLFPVHTWLPDAHTEAPTAGSVILAGVMLKLGTYGLLRYGVYLFPDVVQDLAPLFLTLGVIGIVYGAAVATMQKDLKRLVAYSSVAHMGFIVLGIFALNNQGLTGAVIQMVNHGVSTGALFILVGWIYERRHTREIAALGGLQKSAPLFAGVFTIVMLSSVGLPGLNGFVGEFLVLMGAFSSARWWAVVAATGVVLAALYLLWAYQRVFHGPAVGDNADMQDLRATEFLGILPLVALAIIMGVWPKPFLDRIEPSVDQLIAHVEARSADFEEEEPTRPERTGDEGLIKAAVKAHEKKKAEESGEAHSESDSTESEALTEGEG